jgi:vacuolar-type H+-ATPase subunit E/Vma4
MELDPTDELLADVATKHGISLGRDDPILILHTINARLIREQQEAQERMVHTLRQEFELAAANWGADAKVKADRILNAALSVSTETMNRLMADAGARAAAAVREEIESGLDKLRRETRNMRAVSTWLSATAALMLLAAGVATWLNWSL